MATNPFAPSFPLYPSVLTASFDCAFAFLALSLSPPPRNVTIDV